MLFNFAKDQQAVISAVNVSIEDKMRSMTDEQLKAAGVPADQIRLSVGLEDADDLIEDIKQALERV